MTESSNHHVRNSLTDMKGWMVDMAKKYDMTVPEAKKGLQYLERLGGCYECLLETQICPLAKSWGQLVGIIRRIKRG